MSETFNELLGLLQKKGFEVINFLRNGINDNQIDNILEKKGIALPIEVRDLYKKHDGVEGIDSELIQTIDLCKIGIFLPLEVALDHHSTYVEMGIWEKRFFPLFTSGGGDYYLFNTDRDDSKFGFIFLFSPSNPYLADQKNGLVTFFDSLDSMFKTTIECINNGEKDLEDSGGYSEAIQLRKEISLKNNRVSEYWKLVD